MLATLVRNGVPQLAPGPSLAQPSPGTHDTSDRVYATYTICQKDVAAGAVVSGDLLAVLSSGDSGGLDAADDPTPGDVLHSQPSIWPAG